MVVEQIEFFCEQGDEFLEDGDLDQAAAAYQKAIDADPKCYRAWVSRGLVHARNEDFLSAVRCCSKAIEIDGTSGMAFYNRGVYYEALGSTEAALRDYEVACRRDPDVGSSWINRGRILDDAGRHEEALKCYEAAALVLPEDAVLWSNRGNSLHALERCEEAIESYDRAISLDRNMGAAHMGKGNVLASLGRMEEAVRSFERAELEFADLFNLWSMKGNCLAGLGRLDEAHTCLERAVTLAPDNSYNWSNLAEIQFMRKKYTEALRGFDKALGIDAKCVNALFGKGRTLANMGREPEAEGVARRLKAVAGPEDAGKVASLEMLLSLPPEQPGAPAAARSEEEDAEVEEFTQALGTLLDLHAQGDAYYEEGEFEKALRCYKQAYEANSDFHVLLVNQAACLNSLGRHEEALGLLEQAVARDAGLGEAWYTRSRSLDLLGRGFEAQVSFAKALGCYERDLAEEPGDARIWQYKGDCLLKLGHSWRAKYAYLKAWWHGE